MAEAGDLYETVPRKCAYDKIITGTQNQNGRNGRINCKRPQT
jgi:hypothetical protein